MEMPELNKLVEKCQGKDVVFLGFANNNQSKVESFLKTKTFNYHLIAGSIPVGLHKTLKTRKTGGFFIINLFIPLSHLLFTLLSLQMKQKFTLTTLHLSCYFTYILLHLLLKQTHNEYRQTYF